MKNNISSQLIFKSLFLGICILALLMNIGIFTLGSGELFSNFNPLFINDYFNWSMVMAIIAMSFSIADNARQLKAGETTGYAKRFGLLKFCTASSMLFCIILGTFFIVRNGNAYLLDGITYGDFYPAFLVADFWLDISVLLPRFIVPLSYMLIYFIFEERGKTRGIYGTIGIVMPTIFYFFSVILSLLISAIYGGADALIDAGIYSIVYPYFFFDSAFTFTSWWWALVWPTIFGVSLMILNNIVFYISRITRTEDGKIKFDKKSPVNEDEMHDIIHYFKSRKNKDK